MRHPSTAWAERIPPDEEAHLKRVAEVIGTLQRDRSAKYGPGRALHRKQLLATTGTLEVLDGLPEHARHGLFAAPGAHACWRASPMAGRRCSPTGSPTSAALR